MTTFYATSPIRYTPIGWAANAAVIGPEGRRERKRAERAVQQFVQERAERSASLSAAALAARGVALIQHGMQRAQNESGMISVEVTAIRSLQRSPLLADLGGAVDQQLGDWQDAIGEAETSLRRVDAGDVSAQEENYGTISKAVKTLLAVHERASAVRRGLEQALRSRRIEAVRASEVARAGQALQFGFSGSLPKPTGLTAMVPADPLKGAGVGAAAGAATGATVGLVAGPIGALIGGVIGGVAGAAGGAVLGQKGKQKAKKTKKRAMIEAQQAADQQKAEAEVAAQAAADTARRQAMIQQGMQASANEGSGITTEVNAIRALERDPVLADLADTIDQQLAEWEAVIEEVSSGLREVDAGVADREQQEAAISETSQAVKVLRATRGKATQFRQKLQVEQRNRQANALRLANLEQQAQAIQQQEQYAQLKVDTNDFYASRADADRQQRAAAMAQVVYDQQVEAERRHLASAQALLAIERQNAALASGVSGLRGFRGLGWVR